MAMPKSPYNSNDILSHFQIRFLVIVMILFMGNNTPPQNYHINGSFSESTGETFEISGMINWIQS